MIINNNDKKNFWLNSIGTTINAFISLFLMIIAVRINGSEDAGIFTYAFAISAVFNIIGSYYGRVFQVTDSKDYTDSDYFWGKIITCLLMLLISIVFIFVNNYSFYKSLIIFILILYRTLEAFAEVFYAYFQKCGELYKVGISLILKNVIEIIFFLLIDYFTHDLFLSSLAITIIYLIILIFYDIKSVKIKNVIISKFDYKKIKKLLLNTFNVFILAFLIQIIINLPRYIIDANLTNELNTIWGIIFMPSSIMILVGQFCLHPFIIKLNNDYKNKCFQSFFKSIFKISFGILIIGLFIVFTFYIIGIPVLNSFYGLNLYEYKTDAIIILIGAILYGIQNILYNILVSLRVINEQIYIYIGSIIIFYILFVLLIKNYGIFGASLAYFICMFVLFVVYVLFFLKRLKKEGGFKDAKIKCDYSSI